MDEVQLLGDFESILNSLVRRKNVDVYVTGSNAKFLSKDIITEFRGRGDEVHMYPLTFAEFMSMYEGEKADGWRNYVLYGGIPLVLTFTTPDQKSDFLKSLFEETYISDIIGRNNVRNKAELEELLNILSSSIGSLKADGLYFAFPGEGVSENAFLAALRDNITRYSGVQVELSELKGIESKVGMPTRDLTSEFLVLGMAFLLFVLLVFYYLLRGKREIAVMRLMGVGTGRIWWEMFRTFGIVHPAVLLVLTAVIWAGGRGGLYTAEVMLPAYILFPVCLLFYTGEFAITSGSGIYVHALKGRDYTGGILAMQLMAECAALAAMIYFMSGAYNCMKELGRNVREYQTWTAAGDYGVFLSDVYGR